MNCYKLREAGSSITIHVFAATAAEARLKYGYGIRREWDVAVIKNALREFAEQGRAMREHYEEAERIEAELD